MIKTMWPYFKFQVTSRLKIKKTSTGSEISEYCPISNSDHLFFLVISEQAFCSSQKLMNSVVFSTVDAKVDVIFVDCFKAIAQKEAHR